MVSLGAKVIRALFIGMNIGLIGGLGIYLMAQGVNTLAAYKVVDGIGLLVMVFGASLTAAIGIELSGDIAEKSSSEKPSS